MFEKKTSIQFQDAFDPVFSGTLKVTASGNALFMKWDIMLHFIVKDTLISILGLEVQDENAIPSLATFVSFLITRFCSWGSHKKSVYEVYLVFCNSSCLL